MTAQSLATADRLSWLVAIRRYLAVLTIGNLIWEFAQLPLYTIWLEGAPGEIAFAALHCTGGDILIGTIALVLALLVTGRTAWPAERFVAVAVLTVAIGVGYTMFSEWLNIVVRKSWAYREVMPTLPVVGTGLSPLAQWIVLPTLAFWWIRRARVRPA